MINYTISILCLPKYSVSNMESCFIPCDSHHDKKLAALSLANQLPEGALFLHFGDLCGIG